MGVLVESKDILEKEKLNQQLVQLKQFLGYDPKNERLLCDCINLAAQLDNWQEVACIVDLAIRGNVINELVSAQKGFIHLEHREYDKAEAWFKKALEFNSENVICRYNLAYTLFLMARYVEANDVLQAVNFASVPKSVILQARIYHHLSERTQAEELLERNLDLLDENELTEAKSLLALIYYDSDKLEAAYSLANEILEISVNMEALLAKASVEMERHDNVEAITSFTTLCETYPRIGRAWSGLATVQFNELNIDEAIKSALKATEYMGQHIGTWHLLGWCYLMKGQAQEALKSFEQSYQIDRNFADTHGGLASAYAMLGKDELATRHKKLAKRLDNNAQAYLFAEFVNLYRSGQIEKAKQLIQNVGKNQVATLGKSVSDVVKHKIVHMKRKQ